MILLVPVSLYLIRNTLQVSVCLDPSWTVQQVKTTLAPKLKSNSQDIRIIFAGKELPDNMVIHQCDLGNHSFLHAVLVVAKEKNGAVLTNITSTSVNKDVTLSHVNEVSSSSSSSVTKEASTVFLCIGELKVQLFLHFLGAVENKL